MEYEWKWEGVWDLGLSVLGLVQTNEGEERSAHSDSIVGSSLVWGYHVRESALGGRSSLSSSSSLSPFRDKHDSEEWTGLRDEWPRDVLFYEGLNTPGVWPRQHYSAIINTCFPRSWN